METNYKHDARRHRLSAAAVFLLVTINVRPRWAQSHSSVAPVEVAVEPGEWWIGTGRWRADHLVGSVSCNIAARVPGNEPPESQHLWPYTRCEGFGGQSNVWMVAAQRHTCIPLSLSALTVQGDRVHIVYSYVVSLTHTQKIRPPVNVIFCVIQCILYLAQTIAASVLASFPNFFFFFHCPLSVFIPGSQLSRLSPDAFICK